MKADYRDAFADVVEGIASWRLWSRLGWQEIRRRYRRTVLGPLWVTFSLGIFIAGLGFVWAPLFHAEVRHYLPFVTAGMISWTFVSGIITEGCTTYVAAESLIKQLNFPLSTLNWMLISRSVIVLFHNLAIAVIVYTVLGFPVTWATLLFFPGVVLVSINGVWLSMLFGLVSTRFRDLPQLVGNVVQVMMFVTPVFWFSSQLGPNSKIVNYNLLYHIIEVIRAPLLGEAPTSLNYIATIGMAVVGWTVTFFIFARLRSRIAFWL